LQRKELPKGVAGGENRRETYWLECRKKKIQLQPTFSKRKKRKKFQKGAKDTHAFAEVLGKSDYIVSHVPE